MEPSLYRYILNHSKRDQIGLIILSLATLPLVYINLELPKKIINLLEGADIPQDLFGYELDRLGFLMFFSFALCIAAHSASGCYADCDTSFTPASCGSQCLTSSESRPAS
jgi:putative ABC transport system ATP-binding protein